jgi:hypothetical protein
VANARVRVVNNDVRCDPGPLARAERQMMTDQVLRGIAELPACPSHWRGRAGVLECGSALPLFGRHARRPQAPGPGRGSSASPVCASATTWRCPGNPRRVLFNPCNRCNLCNLCNSFNSFDSLAAAQARFLGRSMISAPFLPHFCLTRQSAACKIQFPVLFGSLWFPLVHWVAGRAVPARRLHSMVGRAVPSAPLAPRCRSSPGVARGQKNEIWLNSVKFW